MSPGQVDPLQDTPWREVEGAPGPAPTVFCSECQNHSPTQKTQKLLLGPGDLLCHLLPLVQVCVF